MTHGVTSVTAAAAGPGTPTDRSQPTIESGCTGTNASV